MATTKRKQSRFEKAFAETLKQHETKTYIATFWRENPQLKNGGYETKRTIEAKNRTEAIKKAKEINAAYGSLNLLDIEEAPKAVPV